jgi:hypothetical protein
MRLRCAVLLPKVNPSFATLGAWKSSGFDSVAVCQTSYFLPSEVSGKDLGPAPEMVPRVGAINTML